MNDQVTKAQACTAATRAYPDGRTGTNAGYQAHIKAGEIACAVCMATEVARVQAWRIKNGRPPTPQDEIRRNNLKAKFGLTVEQYDKLLADQDGGCAVCGSKFPGGRWGGNFHVDHDHGCCSGRNSCGECIRGLLCAPCNVGLGAFADDIDKLMAAAAYLIKQETP